MKVIIYRDKETKKIVRDSDDYNRVKNGGKTEAEIVAMIEEFNKRKLATQTAEIVELDEVAEFYKTQRLDAYEEKINDFLFMEDRLYELSRLIQCYIAEATDFYKEGQK